MERREYFEQAKRELTHRVKKTPGDSESWRCLAQAHMELEEWDEAINADLEALRLDPKNVWALVLMGNLYFNGKKDIVTARTYFEKALDCEPENTLALTNYAAVLAKCGDFLRADQLFSKAIDLCPNMLNAYYGLALLRFKQNNWGGCYKVAIRGLELGAPRMEDPSRVVFEQLTKLKAESEKKLRESGDVDFARNQAEEDAEAQRSWATEAFGRSHSDDDPVVMMMMMQYMLAAMQTFDSMSEQDVKVCAVQFAMQGTRGYSVAEGAHYSIPALPGKVMSGYQTLAYYYVAMARAFPDKLELLKLPFAKAYEQALRMHDTNL